MEKLRDALKCQVTLYVKYFFYRYSYLDYPNHDQLRLQAQGEVVLLYNVNTRPVHHNISQYANTRFIDGVGFSQGTNSVFFSFHLIHLLILSVKPGLAQSINSVFSTNSRNKYTYKFLDKSQSISA